MMLVVLIVNALCDHYEWLCAIMTMFPNVLGEC